MVLYNSTLSLERRSIFFLFVSTKNRYGHRCFLYTTIGRLYNSDHSFTTSCTPLRWGSGSNVINCEIPSRLPILRSLSFNCSIVWYGKVLSDVNGTMNGSDCSFTVSCPSISGMSGRIDRSLRAGTTFDSQTARSAMPTI